ncbi:MAG: rRNA maturation RNase YbeY [Defluviitaleaceae bacterium]|nr:rRNA maturation RNase YbeY [Defluviitaleaceae bacterium]MCL2239114.1 rRNA maturation RNase YbeY [Defluviitaleaceae bacterium]
MRIYWDETALPEHHRALVTRALCEGAVYAKAMADCELSLSFAAPEEIRALNREYRGKDSETDVLSFPGFPGSPAVGDIVICLDIAQRQAREYGHTYERELAFLAVHGLLHLLGYDHISPEGEAEMRAAQDEILRIIEVER